MRNAPAQQRMSRKRLAGDDEDVGQMMQGRARDRPVVDGGVGKDRVHRQHMLHEGEIGAVVGDVPEGHQRGEERNRSDEGDLGQTGDEHGMSPLLMMGREPRFGSLTHKY